MDVGHRETCKLHTGGGQQTEQWYWRFFGGLFNSSMLLLRLAAVCVVLVIFSCWHGGKAEDAGSASCTGPSITGGMYSARFQATKMQQKRLTENR